MLHTYCEIFVAWQKEKEEELEIAQIQNVEAVEIIASLLQVRGVNVLVHNPIHNT